MSEAYVHTFNNVLECLKYFKENKLFDTDTYTSTESRVLNETLAKEYLYRVPVASGPQKFQISCLGVKYMEKELIGTLKTRNRPHLKDRVFMKMAIQIAKLGTCCRLKVGAILLRKDGSIASGGYNGALSGMKHCQPESCNKDCRCLHTAHAEENALFFSEGEVYTAYVTHEPCLLCTRMLVRRGIRRVLFNKPYSSIADQERMERQQIIDSFRVTWEQLDV